jgi:hypothetical protein
MTAALLERSTVVPAASRLQVAREDIAFHNVSSEAVLIEVTVTNAGDGPSRPRLAAVQAAPLGAFVPWRPLGMLAVPALEPGETTVVRGTARRGRRASLGTPDRVAPAQLLQALAGSRGLRPPRKATAVGLAELPADPFELLGQDNLHWAGNVNVFVNRSRWSGTSRKRCASTRAASTWRCSSSAVAPTSTPSTWPATVLTGTPRFATRWAAAPWPWAWKKAIHCEKVPGSVSNSRR